jgi:glutamine synthetase
VIHEELAAKAPRGQDDPRRRGRPERAGARQAHAGALCRQGGEEGTRFPLSVLNLDIWGEDIDDSPLVFETGDADGVLRPTERGFLPMPWLEAPTALLPIWMFHEDGRPLRRSAPRAGARRAPLQARGLTPVVATELEFYLIDDSGKASCACRPQPPLGQAAQGAETLSMRALDAFDTFFTDLYDACEAMDIPADTAISEAGIGQFEINLMHCPTRCGRRRCLAVQDAGQGAGAAHGFAASFMAKPYPDYAGNGLHTHFSVLDADGRNIFDNGGPAGDGAAAQAVAGCLARCRIHPALRAACQQLRPAGARRACAHRHLLGL